MCQMSLFFRKDFKRQGLLLTSTINEDAAPGLSDMGSRTPQYTGNSHWENLELYLVHIFIALFLAMLPLACLLLPW